VNGADGNLRKEFPNMGDVLMADGGNGFLDTLTDISPIWSHIVADCFTAMTTSKLAEVLDLSYIDAEAVRDVLREREEGTSCSTNVTHHPLLASIVLYIVHFLLQFPWIFLFSFRVSPNIEKVLTGIFLE
jgi:hypothetical protein